MHQEENRLYDRARILLDRLERLSADSSWAHRASGLRGSLIRALDRASLPDGVLDSGKIENLVERGYEILTRAAREIPDKQDKI